MAFLLAFLGSKICISQSCGKQSRALGGISGRKSYDLKQISEYF